MAAFQYLTRSDADKASALNWKPLDRTVIDQQVKLGKVVFVDVMVNKKEHVYPMQVPMGKMNDMFLSKTERT